MSTQIYGRLILSYLVGMLVLSLGHVMLSSSFEVHSRFAVDAFDFTIGFGLAMAFRPSAYSTFGVQPTIALLVAAAISYLGVLAATMYFYGYTASLLPLIISAALMVGIVSICLPFADLKPLLRQGIVLALGTAAISWVYSWMVLSAQVFALLAFVAAAALSWALYNLHSRRT